MLVALLLMSIISIWQYCAVYVFPESCLHSAVKLCITERCVSLIIHVSVSASLRFALYNFQFYYDVHSHLGLLQLLENLTFYHFIIQLFVLIKLIFLDQKYTFIFILENLHRLSLQLFLLPHFLPSFFLRLKIHVTPFDTFPQFLEALFFNSFSVIPVLQSPLYLVSSSIFLFIMGHFYSCFMLVS